jgi:hypothetical protein
MRNIDDAASKVSSAHDHRFLREYKTYGPYVDPAEIPALENRVRLLKELLTVPKDEAFLSLKCVGWQHDPLGFRYIIDFEIPPRYQSIEGSYFSLHATIKDMKGPGRPSLDERMRMAWLLSKAIEKWHAVGWVHEGISSSNVLFFTLKQKDKIDYSVSFLHGFDFSRPDSDPSLGQPIDNIAFNVYRHPERHSVTRKGHRKIHDIYSLGVVLLEIGLWQLALAMLNERNKKYNPELIKQALLAACGKWRCKPEQVLASLSCPEPP